MPLYKSVNLSSPGPIGATTPDTGAFTTLSATPPANTTAFNSTGFSLTGANAQTLLNLAGTWNTSGTPTAFKLNVTDTASNASSLLMDLQVGGTSQFYIRKDGFTFLNNQFGTFLIGNNSSSSVGIGRAGGALTLLIQGGSTQAVNLNGSYITFQASTVIQWSSDLTIFRDAADILAQRRTTNAQTFRLYNTYTDASNYERGFMRWATNVLEIGAEAAGTGTNRSVSITGGNSRNQSITLGQSNDIALTVGGGALNLIVDTNGWRQDKWIGSGLSWFIGSTLNEAGNTNRSGTSIRIIPKGGSGSGAGAFISFWPSPSLASGTTGHTAEEAFRISVPSTGASFCSFGGTTSSFPALKRSSAVLQARLADDSGFAQVQGKLTTDTNYTVTAPLATGYLTIYDASGTAYKVLCST